MIDLGAGRKVVGLSAVPGYRSGCRSGYRSGGRITGQQPGGDLLQKPAHPLVAPLPEHGAAGATGDVQSAPGPRHGDVEQAAFLLQAALRRFGSVAVPRQEREHPFLHAGDHDPLELQSLGVVRRDQRHGADRPPPLLAAFAAGFVQPGRFEKTMQLPAADAERLGARRQLLQVAHPAAAGHRVEPAVMGGEAGALHRGSDQRRHRRVLGHLTQLVVQLQKGAYPGAGRRRQGGARRARPIDGGHGGRPHVEERPAHGSRGRARLRRQNALQRLGADRAPRRGERPPQRDGVGRVDRQDQVGQCVLHLLALEEADRPDQPIGYAQPAERGLERLRLKVHPIENRRLQIGLSIDQLAAQANLRFLIGQLVQPGSRSGPVLRPQGLAQAVAVAFHHALRDRQDLRRGPVVLFQAHDLRAREVVRE